MNVWNLKSSLLKKRAFFGFGCPLKFISLMGKTSILSPLILRKQANTQGMKMGLFPECPIKIAFQVVAKRFL
jgi:hypothetical protein